mgnify:CR=1 FL=1
MSTTENLLLGFGALVIGVTFSYFYFRSDWEFWKEYFRSTRKYYWAEVLIGVSSFICIWSFIPSGRIERL